MIGKTNYYDYLFLNQNKEVTLRDFIETDDTNIDKKCRFIYVDENAWELAIIKSVTLKFKKDLTCDVFMVGGGKTGGTGKTQKRRDATGAFFCTGYGGNGGAGGECINTIDENGISHPINITKNTNYEIIIGDNTNNTQGFGLTAQSGGGASGGTGGRSLISTDNSLWDNSYAVATGGTNSTNYAFRAIDTSYYYPDITFGAGGGGGGSTGYREPKHPSADNQYYTGAFNGQNGGFYGGGRGGSAVTSAYWDNGTPGEAGVANTGAGGGGGAAAGAGLASPRNPNLYIIDFPGGAGGTGIIILHPINFTGFSTFDKYYLFNYIRQWKTSEIGNFAVKLNNTTGIVLGQSANSDLSLTAVNTSNNNSPYQSVSERNGIFSTNNLINLAPYSKLKIKVSSITYPAYTVDGENHPTTFHIYAYIGSSETNSSTVWNNPSSGGLPDNVAISKDNKKYAIKLTQESTTYEINISDLKNGYLCFSLFSNGDRNITYHPTTGAQQTSHLNTEIKISSISLEK